MRFKILFVFISLLASIMANEENDILPQIGTETMPIAKTIFKLIKNDSEKIVDLTGKNFIVVSVRERGSDGRFYAVDSDGTVWWSGPVTSGAPEFRSPSGIFTIFQKKRYHMSTLWPDESGVNNMDYMMKFTKGGHALHKGSVDWMSHGCIHIDPKDVPVI
jgi:lipoprotein-anchoring transpeptidase ErfK/SrfK